MLQQPQSHYNGGLQPPKAGRSRYSKALPAVPLNLAEPSPLPPPTRALPIVPVPNSRPRGESISSIRKKPVAQLPQASFLPPLSFELDSTSPMSSTPSSATTATPISATLNTPTSATTITPISVASVTPITKINAPAPSTTVAPKMAIQRKPIARKPVGAQPPKAAAEIPATNTPVSTTQIPKSNKITTTVPTTSSIPTPATSIPVPRAQVQLQTSAKPPTQIPASAPVSAMNTTAAHPIQPFKSIQATVPSPKSPAPASLSPPLQNPLPQSPSETLSDILSAYARSTHGDADYQYEDEETQRSSYGTSESSGTIGTSTSATSYSVRDSHEEPRGVMDNDISKPIKVQEKQQEWRPQPKSTAQLNTGAALTQARSTYPMNFQPLSDNPSSRGSSSGGSSATVTPVSGLSKLNTAQTAGEVESEKEKKTSSPQMTISQTLDRDLPQPPPPPKNQPLPSASRAGTEASSQERLPPVPAKSEPLVIANHSKSNSKQQIWERRTTKGSKGSRELPNIKIETNHGSTAASVAAQTQPQQPSTRAQPPPQSRPSVDLQQSKKLPSPPQLSDLPSLPAEAHGPGDKPVVPPKESSPRDVDADASTMGSEHSKMRQLKDKLQPGLQHSRGDSSSINSEATIRPPTQNRPPTPEYRKDDAKAPVIEPVVSSVSPAPSPEPAAQKASGKDASAGNQVAATVRPTRRTNESDVNNGGIASDTRKAAPAPETLHPVKSLPDLKGKNPSPVNRPPMPFHENRGGRRDSVASEAGPPGHFRRGSTDSGRGRFPSPGPFNRRPEQSPRFPSPERDPRLVHSDTQGWLYKGRDGTLYPEMQSTREADPRAFNFPMRSGVQPVADGAVIPAAPIKDSHHNCFHRHKNMRRHPNKRHPIACQTCEKQDTMDRWACQFCNLRLCEQCLGRLNGNKRDLQAMLREISINAPLSLQSDNRPGSALGLDMMP